MVSEETKTLRLTTPGAQIGDRRPRTVSVIAKSVFATLLLAGIIAAATYTLHNGIAQQGDEVSASDTKARLEAFRALAPLDLSVVADGDVHRALQSMNLSPDAAKALSDDLVDTASSPQATRSPQNASGSTHKAPQVEAAQGQLRARRVRLVWITLWDTDVEDGDVVRIDSQGYSRTVRLTKKGDTFAVPIPADGLIKVTGVKDGDGGGITVGVGSGNARAIFPIMSEGQQLGLRVRVN